MRVLTVFTDREPAERRWVALAYLLITLTMVCGIASFWLFTRNENVKLAQLQDQRAQDLRDDLARDQRSACIGFNIEQRGDRASALNTALVMFGYAEPGNLTADDRAAIVGALDEERQERYERFEQQVAIDNPYRDCSVEGLRDYYRSPETDPALVESPNG